MQLRFLGGTGTVTGSKYLVEHDGRRLLVDCGLFQGLKQLRLRNWSSLPVPASSIDAVVLTHAHIDHSGFVPRLVELGFRGSVYATPATVALAELLLPDSGHLHEEEARYANRHRYSKHAPALPLYTEESARRALQRFHPREFDEEFEPVTGLQVRFRRAGHILGAASIYVRGHGKTVLFSGDLGRSDDALMKRPAPPQEADWVLVESTYGNRSHAGQDPLSTLADVVRRTAARRGCVIVPAFAVGRAQTLMYMIHQLKKSGRMPNHVPVYLNSPMAIDATRLYLKHHEYHRLTAQECQEVCASVHAVATPEESRRLNEKTRGPAVIIAGSGMATGGRVLHHIKAFGSDPRNTILFAGFQAGGTRGASMVAGAAEVKIHGDYIPIRAEVANIDSLSGHADYVEMLEWLRAAKMRPRRVFVTHGEADAADAMRHHIEESLGWPAEVPEQLQKVKLV